MIFYPGSLWMCLNRSVNHLHVSLFLSVSRLNLSWLSCHPCTALTIGVFTEIVVGVLVVINSLLRLSRCLSHSLFLPIVSHSLLEYRGILACFLPTSVLDCQLWRRDQCFRLVRNRCTSGFMQSDSRESTLPASLSSLQLICWR